MKNFLGKQVTIFIDSIYVQGLIFDINDTWVKLVDLENKMNLIKIDKISIIKDSALDIGVKNKPIAPKVPLADGFRCDDSINNEASSDYVSQFDLLRNK
jgi:hypothetical protein